VTRRLTCAVATLAALAWPATAVAGSSSGEQLSSAHRHLIWADNFTARPGAAPNPAHWSFDTGGGGWGNEELEYYTARRRNAHLDGHGHLQITAQAEPFTGSDGVGADYTSARLQTLHAFQFEYGLVQARIEVPAGQGLLPTFWMLGANAYHPGGWPACGEIDAMEVLGSDPTVLKGTLHGPWPWAPHGIGGMTRVSRALSSGFHVYAVEWTPQRISFLLDGAVYDTIGQSDLPPGAPWPFQHPFFLLLNLSVGGVAAGAPGPLTRFPAKMRVDWVRVWH
jgi:beta-glucanase (GH16 family)